jgi:hypothetical protein
MCMQEHHQISMVVICKTSEMIEGIMFMNMFNIWNYTTNRDLPIWSFNSHAWWINFVQIDKSMVFIMHAKDFLWIFLCIYTFHHAFIYNKLKCIYLFDIGNRNISANIDGFKSWKRTTYIMFQTPSNNDILVGREMHIKCCQLPCINGHSGQKEMNS